MTFSESQPVKDVRSIALGEACAAANSLAYSSVQAAPTGEMPVESEPLGSFMVKRRSLDMLAACLRGTPTPAWDWMAVIESANRSLVTPALAEALRRSPDRNDVPADVSTYLELITARNGERNTRLKAQLSEAVEALNGEGITPVLLKGAAWLVASTPEDIGRRLLADLDLMVPSPDMPRARACLKSIGYEVATEFSDPALHFHADLWRPSDAAMIDLHRRPPGPAVFHDPDVLRRNCTEVPLGRGIAQVPSPTLQALHLMVHDLFHEGDYWLGNLDLRHLMDLAMLAEASPGIDWNLLQSLMPGSLARHALETQLVTLHHLLGTPIPSDLLQSRRALWQYRRRLLQVSVPSTRLFFAALTIATEWTHYRRYRRLARSKAAPSNPRDGSWRSRVAGKARRLHDLIAADGTGKL